MNAAEHRAENHTETVQERFAEFNVLATYRDMETARAALTALERAGIDAARVSLLTRSGEDASEHSVPTGVEQRQVDLEMAGDVGKRAAVGAGAGGAAGAALGVASALVIPGLGPALGVGLLALAAGGAWGGGIAGGLLAAFTGQPASQAWQSTFEAVKEGQVAVAAHVDDRPTLENAAEALRALEPTNLVEFDADGERIDPT